MNSYIISSVLAISAGFSISTYPEYAMKQGWPIGKFYFKYKRWIAVISLLAILGGTIELFSVTKWFYAILSVGAGLLLSWVLTVFFKQNVQWIAFVLLIVSLLVFFIGGAEIVEV